MGPSSIGLFALVTGCFNPDPTPFETESATATAGATESETGSGCVPGASQACACTDGASGRQVCSADGNGFGACECDAADSGSTTSPGSTTEDPPPPECEVDDDCAAMAEGECQQGLCGDDGTCMVQPLRAGTPCGDATATECSAADTCDGEGTCSNGDAAEGSSCTDCALGVCSCTAGVCGDCSSFATSNDFITTRAVEGWTLTGGWTLYREAPQSFDSDGSTVFEGQVLGTDGNRVAPYPGTENELSSARTPPMVLPATLSFLSWNVDEGSGVDDKRVQVSIDGGLTFVTVAQCSGAGPFPFCQFRGTERQPDDWDEITIPLPPELVGQVGIVELTYNTLDSCCGFEQGWYIDVTNFGTECACVLDESCAGLGSECGAAVCGATGACALEAVAAGTACGDATDVECNAADACDGVGYCAPNLASTGLTSCEDCPAGSGSCHVCQAGVCPDCVSQPAVNDFTVGSMSFTGWLIEDLSGGGADWRIYFSAPQSQTMGSVASPLSLAPSFGTDGNRQEPYPGAETEHSRVTTTPDVVPAMLTFDSWHVDEGSGADNKTIEVSVDGGVTWQALPVCPGQPFCNFRNDPRTGDDWDAIAIPTGAFAGQVGQLRFTYNTGDGCCGFERGWFIDNLNFARYCSDPLFP